MLTDLVRLVASPAHPTAPEGSWDETTDVLGLRFGDDYRQLVETYGEGWFGGELHLLDPRSMDPYWDLVEHSLDALTHDYVEQLEPPPLPGYPSSGSCLVELASNGYGDSVYGVAEDGLVDDLRLWIGNIREVKWLSIPGPLSHLLSDVLARTGRHAVITKTFGVGWTLPPTFAPPGQAAAAPPDSRAEAPESDPQGRNTTWPTDPDTGTDGPDAVRVPLEDLLPGPVLLPELAAAGLQVEVLRSDEIPSVTLHPNASDRFRAAVDRTLAKDTSDLLLALRFSPGLEFELASGTQRVPSRGAFQRGNEAFTVWPRTPDLSGPFELVITIWPTPPEGT